MNIQELKAMEAAATPGPWLPSVHSESHWNPRIEPEEARRFWPVWVIQHDDATTIQVKDRTGFKQAMKDAELIAALRNLAPELIALLEAVEVYDRADPHSSEGNQARRVMLCYLIQLQCKLKEVKP